MRLASHLDSGGESRLLGQSKTFYRLLQQIMDRMSLNKIADTDLETFLPDPDSFEGLEGQEKSKGK
jgi:hypothetical protein